MTRRTLACLAFSALGLSAARAQIPVTDAGAIAQRSLHEAFNLTEYLYTAENTLNTYLTEYKELINSYEQLYRMGNANYLKSLIGSSEIGQLYGQSQQLYQEINQLPHSFNPQNYQNDFNSVLSSWQQPQWTGYATYSGYHVAPRSMNYQYETAITHSVDKVLGFLENVQHEREKWLNKRDEARQALDQSGDDAQTRKNGFALLDNDAAVAQIDQKTHQVVYQGQLLQQKVQSAQRMAQKAQMERQQAATYQSIDHDLDGLQSNGFHDTARWNQN